MDKHARFDHLLDLLGSEQSIREHLLAQRAKIESHHASRERDRLLTHTTKGIGRSEKAIRSLERAIRNEKKSRAA